jgi:hypothetical protein
VLSLFPSRIPLSFTARSLERAGCWFLRSGIQEPTGGIARYYYSDICKNARVSTEITGYGLSALTYLYRRLGDTKFLDAALRAGRFLVDTAWDSQSNTFPFEHSSNGDQPQPLAYFFDCGIIVRGLLSLWRASGEARFLNAAEACGRSMARDFGASQTFHPIVRLPDKSPLPYTSQWSRQPGCYQLKSAMAWFDLYEATGHEEFKTWYESGVEVALAQENSFLPASTQEKTMDRLHAYLYFLEGLLPVADRTEVRAALSCGMNKVSNHLREIAPIFERSDVSAQLLRVRLFAAEQAGIPLDKELAADEAARMETFQAASEDQRIDGGFYFGRKAGDFLPFVNPVSTAFCMQAMSLWNDSVAGNLELDRGALI